MNMAVVGAARVVFGADTSDFDAGAKGVEGVLGRLVDKFEAVERKLKRIGVGVTLGITVPFAAMVKTIDKDAGSFEAQMNKVRAALMDASPDQINALSDAARKMGPAVGVGATEAAGAIDSLARAGVSAADILGGALDATLKLSAAGMTDAESAAGLVTDVMGQFGKTAADLPAVMTNIVGALDASKMGFDDFRLAVGQGGAIAAASGVSFEDFSTAIAATSTMFASGADAGTSFKTYIQTLTGKSKEAQKALSKLGISFYDQSGALKPLNEQAQILQDALGGLTDKSKQDALTPIFGADAARTAIGLMNQGREGFEKYRDAVANGDVNGKIAVMMQGSEAAGKRIAAAWEGVKISLGLDTGLLKFTTAIKNGFASLLEAIANAPVSVKKVGAAFAAFGAALGPLLVVLGHVGAVLLANFAASKFGLIGRALGLIIAPVSTVIGLLGEMGLARVLAMVGSRLLAFMGPVGLVISAILLFKDEIAFALSAVWASMTETLGPPVQALFAKLTDLFAKLSGGPIGSAIDGLISLLSGLKDVVGTVLVGAIMLAGEVIERVIGGVIAIFSGVVDIISGVVDVVSALLTGDFSGAWEAAGRVVEAVYDTIINVISALVPEISAPLQQAWAAAKKWLADGFQTIVGWFTSSVQSGVNFVANAFPNVVAAAKGVYQGVKAWLVDKFGTLMTWIGKAATWIGDKWGALQERLGLGKAGNDNTGAAPGKPEAGADPAPAAKKTVNFDEEKKKRTKKGRDTTYDAGNRQQLQDDLELEAARLRGDIEAERAIRNRLDLSKQIEAYQRTGLSLEQATAAAKRDMATLEAARREGLAKDLDRDEAAHQIDLARITDNGKLEETLQRQQDLKNAILGFQRDGLSIEEATARAIRQQLETDQARAEIRARLIAESEQDRQLELAKTRGDSEERIRQLQREVDIRKRIQELKRDFPDMDDGQAQDQASREWDEMDKARQTGVFRDTFKSGVRAALDGDLGGFLKNWWRDRVAKGMEEALNSLADLISKLFSNISGSGGGGGILGSIGKVVGKVLGGGSGGFDKSAAAGVDWNDLPKFQNGGRFKVGGNPGIDQNLVSFRASAGEIVDIQKPGNDNGGSGGVTVNQKLTFSGAIDLATKEEAIRFADAGRQAAINAINEANRRRG
ncbi:MULTISPECIES: phage tail tape measure protein [unclassified Novosphingobium]|uniref:phage tail tape measure protein n=1 Tax=unclassified Novosphingobium TaxID=2644732 RepID=UPI00135786DB|nr:MULTISPECIES: phage tail tape measure protein [unclassified Novosphingobium]